MSNTGHLETALVAVTKHRRRYTICTASNIAERALFMGSERYSLPVARVNIDRASYLRDAG
jgi:hypothetical protein